MQKINSPEAKWACAIVAFVLVIGTALAQYTPPSGGGGGTNYWAASGGDIYNDNAGNVGIGAAPNSGLVSRLDVFGGISMETATSTPFAYAFTFNKRGATGDATAAVKSGTELGYGNFNGWNGSAYVRGALAIAYSREDFSLTSSGTGYYIYTTPVGTNNAGNLSALFKEQGVTLGNSQDWGLQRSSTNTGCINQGGDDCSSLGSLTLSGISGASYSTNTVCASGATPAVCGASAAGSVAIPTGVTTVTLVVGTTAVTASSQIILTPDDSITIPMTTCNSTLATLVGGMAVTARTAGTSFTITYNGTIAANPLCVSYQIIN